MTFVCLLCVVLSLLRSLLKLSGSTCDRICNIGDRCSQFFHRTRLIRSPLCKRLCGLCQILSSGRYLLGRLLYLFQGTVHLSVHLTHCIYQRAKLTNIFFLNLSSYCIIAICHLAQQFSCIRNDQIQIVCHFFRHPDHVCNFILCIAFREFTYQVSLRERLKPVCQCHHRFLNTNRHFFAQYDRTPKRGYHNHKDHDQHDKFHMTQILFCTIPFFNTHIHQIHKLCVDILVLCCQVSGIQFLCFQITICII